MPSLRNLMVVVVLASCLSACHSSKSDSDPFQLIAANDLPLPPAVPGSWRQAHPEQEQTLKQFKKNSVLADSTRRYIQIRLVGPVSPIADSLLPLLAQHLLLYYQLPVRQLAPAAAVPPDSCTRQGQNGQLQWRADWILDTVLHSSSAPGAAATAGVTSIDLYPSDSWNFVMGLASYNRHVSISSWYRLQPAGSGTGISTSLLTRLLKTVTHETGHMLGLAHCQQAACCMNGSNSVAEADRQPIRLCSQCLGKISSLRTIDTKRRTGRLMQWYRRHGLADLLQELKADSVALASAAHIFSYIGR